MNYKFKLGDRVNVIGTNIVYTIKDIIAEPKFNSVLYNDFIIYNNPSDNSFYESELQLLKD